MTLLDVQERSIYCTDRFVDDNGNILSEPSEKDITPESEADKILDDYEQMMQKEFEENFIRDTNIETYAEGDEESFLENLEEDFNN